MSEEPFARGRALIGALRFVKSQRGQAGLDELRRGASPALAAVLEGRIAQAAWYPYAVYVELLRLTDLQLGKGDLEVCRELGQWAGAQDLGSMFKIYAMLASADRLIRSSKLVWPQYYKNCGEMQALSTAPGDTRLRITGFSAMDPSHCRLMEGWMIATMAQIGCHVNRDGRETTCTSRGDPHHEFACTWSTTRPA
ncbi:MAG: hypothetical protein K8H88_18060 [Sandaracinaceae bacterium]|nr:hypothetical protein [Sandaracinaceae bacterium]